MPDTAAILLSRQPLHPCGRDEWVRSADAAIRWIRTHGHTLGTSIGMQTWELVLALASLMSVKTRVFIPALSEEEFTNRRDRVLQRFDLQNTETEFVPVLPESAHPSKQELLSRRDETVIRNADLLLPVSVRRNGHMSRLIEAARQQGKEVIESFMVPYQSRSETLAYTLSPDSLTPDVVNCGRRYLIHWTRAANGPWPTERCLDYYASVRESSRYPRSGFCTLLNILQSGCIVATDKHMPHRIPTVSFSGLSPAETLPLMTWRARYRQMSFEPYGIGIDRDSATAYRIEPVFYYDPGEGSGVAGSGLEPWLTQSRGARTDWRAEDEYRCRDSLRLERIPRAKLLVFCKERSEAEQIRRLTDLRVISFY